MFETAADFDVIKGVEHPIRLFFCSMSLVVLVGTQQTVTRNHGSTQGEDLDEVFPTLVRNIKENMFIKP